MKTCIKCGVLKPISDYYKHPKMADGTFNKCKACYCVDVKAAQDRRREEYRTYWRERPMSEHERARRRAYSAKWSAQFPERMKAQSAARYAVFKGEITRLPCWVCNDPETEAHHPDYSQPLDVIWLCRACHKQAHALAYYVNKEAA